MESRPEAFSARIAFSTLDQAVFCVRIAPTMTSNLVRPGHQCRCPFRARRIR